MKKETIIAILLAIIVLLTIDGILVRKTGTGLWGEAEKIISTIKTAHNDKKGNSVSVSEKRFLELFQKLCPELLTERGIPVSDVYKAMLKQFANRDIDEAFVQELLRQMNDSSTIFDGKRFYGFEYEGVSDPEELMDTENLKKETISIKFYLDNVDWYSKDIFRKLTKQNKVKFALKITDQGYLFEALEEIKSSEFLAICSDGTLSINAEWIDKGDAFYIPTENIRRISRIAEFEQEWQDHKGISRSVAVNLDLATFREIPHMISQLPDGKIVKIEEKLIRPIEEELEYQRTKGVVKVINSSSWDYTEDNEAVFKVRNNRVIFSKWGNCEKITFAAAKNLSNGKTILKFTEITGRILFVDYSGEIHRIVTGKNVLDGNENPITDRSDIAYQWLKQGRTTHETPNLNEYVSLDPFIKLLAKTICNWYDNEEDQKNGILSFVQSFKYQPMNIRGKAKTPKDSFLSKEADCEDASILAMSLFSSSGFDTGYITARNVIEGKPGHAIPVVESKNGSISYGNKKYAIAEATNPGFKIGDRPDYSDLIFEFLFIYKEGTPNIFSN